MAGYLSVYLVAGARRRNRARGNTDLYQRIDQVSIYLLAAVLTADLLTAAAVWYEIYYVADDSATATIKAIFLDAAAAVAVAILLVATVETVMVLHKLILEKYLNNRFVKGQEVGEARGLERGWEQANEEWLAWYDRMVEARERGEEFDEPPPEAPGKKE